MLKIYLELFKIKHYLKNILIFVPFLFFGDFNFHNIKNLFLGFISFCLISSCVYIINDILDKKGDSSHPIKSKRPIANNKITINKALFIATVLFCLSFIFIMPINIKLFVFPILYFILNLLYSAKIKNYFFFDAIFIASGFILRILLGFFIIKENFNFTIILLTFFTSLFFTFSKRFYEISFFKNSRKSLEKINKNTIKFFTISTLTISTLIFAYFVFKQNNSFLYCTIPLFSILLFRIHFLNSKNPQDMFLLFKKDFLVQILFFCCFLFLIVYSKIFS